MTQYLVVMKLGNGDMRRVRVDADSESDAILAAKQIYRRQHYGKGVSQHVVTTVAIKTNEERYGND